MTQTIDVSKNYNLLAAAIVKRAIQDYERSRKKNEKSKIIEIRNFFYSEWFMALAKSDGPAMFKKIEDNYNTYGKCMPFKKGEDEDDLFLGFGE